MFKKGLIIINAYSTLAHGLNQSYRLKEEFNALGVEADIARNDFFAAMIDGKDAISMISGYDFVVYQDKDKYIALMLEKAGVRLFNRPVPLLNCDDKMLTHIALSNADIKMPITLSGILCYDRNEHTREESFRIIEDRLGYPIVFKECYGSLGKNVYLANDRKELENLIEKFKCSPYLLQQFIRSSKGRDVRVIVIGGKAVAAMQRVSQTDFRANIELGGQAQTIELPQSFKEMAEKAAKVLELDYCGVDLLFGENGEPILCEVNSNAFFGAIERVTGINIGRLYAQYIVDTIYIDK